MKTLVDALTLAFDKQNVLTTNNTNYINIKSIRAFIYKVRNNETVLMRCPQESIILCFKIDVRYFPELY